MDLSIGDDDRVHPCPRIVDTTEPCGTFVGEHCFGRDATGRQRGGGESVSESDDGNPSSSDVRGEDHTDVGVVLDGRLGEGHVEGTSMRRDPKGPLKAGAPGVRERESRVDARHAIQLDSGVR